MAFRLVNREKLLSPHRCILCERTPTARVVDSGYNLIRGVPVKAHMRGRKYICETCGELLAKAFGFLSHQQAANLKEEVITLQNRIEELKEQAAITEAVADLKGYLVGMNNGGEDETPEAEVAEQDGDSA